MIRIRGGQRSVAVLLILLTAAVALSVLRNTGVGPPVEGFVAGIISPVRGALNGLASGASNKLSDFGDFGALEGENRDLRARVASLEAEAARLRTAADENTRLRQALNYVRRESELQFVTARVLGRDSLDVLDTVVIDRGAAAGVRVGMAVVANGSLAGRVTGVTDRTADVLPIHSRSSSVNVVVDGPAGPIDGILDGVGDGTLLMRRIDSATPPALDDVVITSGLGGGFPRGLAIGRIVAIGETAASVFREAAVQPFAAARELDIVQVVAGQGSAS